MIDFNSKPISATIEESDGAFGTPEAMKIKEILLAACRRNTQRRTEKLLHILRESNREHGSPERQG